MDTGLTSRSKLLSASLPLRAVLFDWGNTLVRFTSPNTGESSDFAALKTLHAEMASWGPETAPIASVPCAQFLEVYVEVWAEQYSEIVATLKEGTMYDLFVGMLARLAPQLKDDDRWPLKGIAARMAQRTDELLPWETEAMPGAEELLKCLRGSYHLGVVSNLVSSAPVHQSLEMHGLSKYLSVVVVSAEVGFIKPSPVPFQSALNSLGLRPHEVLFVGDDPTTDMHGAKTLGMSTVLLKREETECPEADFAVEDLSELAAIIEGLAAYGQRA